MVTAVAQTPWQDKTIDLAKRALDTDDNETWVKYLREMFRNIGGIRAKLTVEDLLWVLHAVAEASVELAEAGATPDWPEQALGCSVATLLEHHSVGCPA